MPFHPGGEVFRIHEDLVLRPLLLFDEPLPQGEGVGAIAVVVADEQAGHRRGRLDMTARLRSMTDAVDGGKRNFGLGCVG